MNDDLISRQAAIDICANAIDLWHGQIGEGALVAVRDKIAELTPAEPKRIRGKWIEHEHGYWTFVNADGERDGWIPDYECDQCGSRGWKEVAPMNFCPNCGARMEGN